MLQCLEIRDFVIVSFQEFEFQEGLNVFTGETGAGKSILLDALGFVLGMRGPSDLVRSGAQKAEVTAVFDISKNCEAQNILDDVDCPQQRELILRRTISREGRKSAWVNDRRVSAEVLRNLSDVLVEIHGRHDERGLLDPKGHRALLDAFGNHRDITDAVAQAWLALSTSRHAYFELEQDVAKAQADELYLRHAVSELISLDPQPDEDMELDAQRRLMQNAERIRGDLLRAKALLGADGAEGSMEQAARWLNGVSDKSENRLDDPLASLSRALIELAEAQSGLDRVLAELDFNPSELEAVEERFFAIRTLARKHSISPNDLGTLKEDMCRRIEALDAGSARLIAAERAVSDAESQFQEKAVILSQARRAAAKNLDQAVRKELAPLRMEHAVFSSQVDPAEPGRDGVDSVIFAVSTNPGASAGALNKIASGGELSRFLLALKVCLVGANRSLTMIFDEIDRGIGGSTADAVGQRLADLSKSGQILVVTHSPQVAAKGDHHWRVTKQVKNGSTFSFAVPLQSSERVQEVARMLAGNKVTEAAVAAAKELLTNR